MLALFERELLHKLMEIPRRAIIPKIGYAKIAVMKVVKEVLGLGLKEAKDLVDGAPATLKDGMKKAEAEELKKKIEAAGGKITLK